MQFSKTYLMIIGLFGAFIVVSTLQLGKSRTTISVIEKQAQIVPSENISRDAQAIMKLYAGSSQEERQLNHHILASREDSVAWFEFGPRDIKSE